jgi:BirA family biotin operon repressor/biotin-[acetyl-CoA-carboxylase] ligase
MADPLPRDLARALAATVDRRRRLGEPVVYFEETGSTNDVAARLADEGAPEGTLVIAARQTAGRGRLGRQWFSPPGAGLYASVVCRSARLAPFVTLAGGVAVAEGVTAATGLPVEIKWPNDVVVPGGAGGPRFRKLSGILAEGSSSAQGLHYVVLGFGVNLKPAAYPPELRERATSIESELGRPVDAGLVLAETLAALADAFAEIEDGRAQDVLARWRAKAPALEGSAVEFESAGARTPGVAAGLAEDGALLVRTAGGVVRVLSGEVIWK